MHLNGVERRRWLRSGPRRELTGSGAHVLYDGGCTENGGDAVVRQRAATSAHSGTDGGCAAEERRRLAHRDTAR
ncbi:ABC transporter ATP-binding protein [Sesbania bispinosa]|nr:ABC transporter ATP-binding protein [Sesbania bispinosa]